MTQVTAAATSKAMPKNSMVKVDTKKILMLGGALALGVVIGLYVIPKLTEKKAESSKDEPKKESTPTKTPTA